jgi:hypothetical protein
VFRSTLSKVWNTCNGLKEAQILFTSVHVVEVLYDKACDYLHKPGFYLCDNIGPYFSLAK